MLYTYDQSCNVSLGWVYNNLRVISLESNAVVRTCLPRFMETKHRREPKLLDICVSPSHEQRLTNNAACLTGVPGGKARSIATFIVQLSS